MREPGKELYSIALASTEPLPATQPFVMLTKTTDIRWWQEVVDGLRSELDAKATHVQQLEGWLRAKEADLKALHAGYAELRAGHAELEEVVREMQATRVWQLGTTYWNLRDRLLRRA